MREGLLTIADLVERIEGGGVVVDDVSLSRTDGEELAVDVSLRLPADGSEAVAVGETDGGQRQLTVHESATAAAPASTAAPSSPGPDFGSLAARVGGAATRAMDAEAVASRAGEPPDNGAGSSSDDEPITCRVAGCEETFETEHGMKIHATKAHQAADGSAPSPHRDPERLREVYGACDTFEEMTEALDVDVTAQTVRRSMMSLGIHDPDADGPGPGAGSPGEAASTDGGEGGAPDEAEGATDTPDDAGTAAAEPDDLDDAADLDADDLDDADDSDDANDANDSGDATTAVPDEVDAALPPAVDGAAFVEAVREANTLYEVQRRLGMGRDEVQTLLAELDLLDLVHGRVATRAEREERKAEIERRIVEGAGDGGVHVGAE